MTGEDNCPELLPLAREQHVLAAILMAMRRIVVPAIIAPFLATSLGLAFADRAEKGLGRRNRREERQPSQTR